MRVVGMRVEIWRTAVKMDAYAKHRELQASLLQQMRDSSRNAALNNFRVICARMVKGEVGMRVEIWRIHAHASSRSKHLQMQAALEAQMQAQGQGAGLRQLRQIMVRLVKGEVGLRVEIWRTAMKDEVRATEMARLQSDLEARAADASKGAALRQLRQIMVRIMKGEAAMRLEVWRQLLKMDAYAKHAELAAALEAQMRAQGQGAGLRMLKQCLARVMRGEL